MPSAERGARGDGRPGAEGARHRLQRCCSCARPDLRTGRRSRRIGGAAGNVNLVPEGAAGRAAGRWAATTAAAFKATGRSRSPNVPPGGTFCAHAATDAPSAARDYVPPQFACAADSRRRHQRPDCRSRAGRDHLRHGDIPGQSVHAALSQPVSGHRVARRSLRARPQLDRARRTGRHVPARWAFRRSAVLRSQAPRRLVTEVGRSSTAATSIDTPFEVRSGEKVTGVELTFTDRLSEIIGTITDDAARRSPNTPCWRSRRMRPCGVRRRARS